MGDTCNVWRVTMANANQNYLVSRTWDIIDDFAMC